MTKEAKPITGTETCSKCVNRYEVKYNTPNGIDSLYYCKQSSKNMPYGFLLTNDVDSCENFKRRNNE